MITITVPRGDYGFALNFAVVTGAGAAFNLTGYTITFKMWRPTAPSTLLINGACVIDNAAGGLCHYTVASGNFASIGVFDAELELTATGKVESTLPIQISVIASG